MSAFDAELLAMFQAEADSRLAAIAAGDAPLADLAREAHTVKGAAAIVGLGGISQAAARIEQALRSGRAPGEVAGAVALMQEAVRAGVDVDPERVAAALTDT